MMTPSFMHMNMVDARKGWTPDKQFIDYNYDVSGKWQTGSQGHDQHAKESFAELAKFVAERNQNEPD